MHDPASTPVQPNRDPPRWFVRAVRWGGASIVAILITAWILTPSRHRGEPATKIKCASNLRQIGLGILLYINEHDGQPPKDFGTLLLHEDLTPGVFVCPSTSDEQADGATLEERAKNLNDSTKKHASYFFVSGPVNDKDAEQVLAFEPPENHNGDGSNVLFADGHVDFVGVGRQGNGREIYDKFFADYKAGVRPLHWPVKY